MHTHVVACRPTPVRVGARARPPCVYITEVKKQEVGSCSAHACELHQAPFERDNEAPPSRLIDGAASIHQCPRQGWATEKGSILVVIAFLGGREDNILPVVENG
ncbi:hypothetical protein MRX96_038133 [Rhipicephalus microplus]